MTMPADQSCPKCGGWLAIEHIGTDVDIACINCGWRQVAAARVKLQPSAVTAVGMVANRVGNDPNKSWEIITKDCVHCNLPFEGTINKRYCSNYCGIEAKNLRERGRKVTIRGGKYDYA